MRFIVAILGFALAVSASAQTSKTLSLGDAIRTAIANNADLKIARLDMDKADQQVRQAWGHAMPSLNFDATYTRALKVPVFFFEMEGKVTPIRVGSDNAVLAGFTATQVLFNSAVFIGVGTASVWEKASHENYRAVYNRTVTNTQRAFYAALLTRQVHATTVASMKNAEENFNNVRILNEQGIVSDYDRIRAEVQVENVRPMVIEAEKNVLVALNALKIAIGLGADEPLDVTGALEFQPVDSLRIVESLVDDNATVRWLEYQRDISGKVMTITRSEYLPTLAAFGNYQWQAQKNSLAIGSRDFISSSQVGLSLSVNLFNGFQTTSRVSQAQSDKRKTEEQISNLKTTLRTQVQSIKLRIHEAERRVRSQQRTVELAEKTYQIATTRYRTGSGTQLEVNDADVALLRARLNRVQAVFDHLMAVADLDEIFCSNKPE